MGLVVDADFRQISRARFAQDCTRLIEESRAFLKAQQGLSASERDYIALDNIPGLLKLTRFFGSLQSETVKRSPKMQEHVKTLLAATVVSERINQGSKWIAAYQTLSPSPGSEGLARRVLPPLDVRGALTEAWHDSIVRDQETYPHYIKKAMQRSEAFYEKMEMRDKTLRPERAALTMVPMPARGPTLISPS